VLKMRPTRLAMLATVAFGASVAGCHTVNPDAALNCGALIGPTLRADVPGADLPVGNTVGDWVAFGDAQTGKLEDANGRRAAVVEIVDRCQAEQARLTRPRFLGLF
jgi:hypothetical protein